MTAMIKKKLRAQLRALHEGVEARDVQSCAVCRHILASAAYQNARVIGGYIPMQHEVDVRPVLEDALAQGKTLVLPLCSNPPFMTMRRVGSMTELTPGAYGIPEPPADSESVQPSEIDLLLVPLEGIDHRGFRLGKGGGYYDRLLADTDVYSIGCALTWQWVEEVPREAWDQPLCACAGADGLHIFKT